MFAHLRIVKTNRRRSRASEFWADNAQPLLGWLLASGFTREVRFGCAVGSRSRDNFGISREQPYKIAKKVNFGGCNPSWMLAEQSVRPEKGATEDRRQLPQPVRCNQPYRHLDGTRDRTQTRLEQAQRARSVVRHTNCRPHSSRTFRDNQRSSFFPVGP